MKLGAAPTGLLAALVFWGSPASAAGDTLPIVAVAAFDYGDSSGEPGDQSADHARRTVEFRDRLEQGLEDSAVFAPTSLSCAETKACSAATLPPDMMLATARDAKADLLVFGGIHKMSTLVGWGRVDVLDVVSGKLLFDRVISFRGDSDEAFQRAADFAVKDIVRTLGTGARTADGSRGIR